LGLVAWALGCALFSAGPSKDLILVRISTGYPRAGGNTRARTRQTSGQVRYYPRVKFCAHARTRRVKYPRISVPVDKIAIPIRANQPAIATPTPTRGANSIPVTAKQNYAYERVNHVAVEEAQEAPDVVIGMFLINDTSAVVLFDSGASHSFISATYVRKYNLPLALLRC
jgi:hypothetical protein